MRLPLSIGHATIPEAGTGVTVFLFEAPTVATVYVPGSAPANREIELLSPGNIVSDIHALVFSGGSAYGLSAADGVMRYLREKNRGYPTKYGLVPIVPAAAIYDFSPHNAGQITPDLGYQACQAAQKFQMYPSNFSARTGAAAGASVGKLLKDVLPMPTGLGMRSYHDPNTGLIISVWVVLNAVGDVYDTDGTILAGARDLSGNYISQMTALQQGADLQDILQQNTSLVAVLTNAHFDKAALWRIAKVSAAGLARVISPCFTAFDGDSIFLVSIPEVMADETRVACLSAALLGESVRAACVVN